MEKVVLKAGVRETNKKSDKNKLRRDGFIPGIYYSKHDQPISISIAENLLNPLVFTSETHLISLLLDAGQEHDCIIKDVQFDPVTDKVTHFDLLGLTAGEKFQLEVPLQFIGSPAGIKEGGILQQFLHKLDVECFPQDIPQHLEINIQDLSIGDSIHVKDLKFENIEIINDEDTVIVAVSHPKVEAEPVAATEGVVEGEESAEPEVIGKGKTDKEEEADENK
jgi:large subunit ribosomal protein L25